MKEWDHGSTKAAARRQEGEEVAAGGQIEAQSESDAGDDDEGW